MEIENLIVDFLVNLCSKGISSDYLVLFTGKLKNSAFNNKLNFKEKKTKKGMS